jgi:hypothetical protein
VILIEGPFRAGVAGRLVAFEEDEPLGRAAAEPVPGAEAGQILRPHRDDPLLSVLRASQMEPLLVEADVQPVEPDDLSDAEPLIEAQRDDRFEPDVEAGFLPGLDLLALATLEDAEKLSEFVFVDHLLGGLFLLLGIPDRLADIVFDPFPLLEPPEEHLAVAQVGALGLSRQLLSEAEVANVFRSDHAYQHGLTNRLGKAGQLVVVSLAGLLCDVRPGLQERVDRGGNGALALFFSLPAELFSVGPTAKQIDFSFLYFSPYSSQRSSASFRSLVRREQTACLRSPSTRLAKTM